MITLSKTKLIEFRSAEIPARVFGMTLSDLKPINDGQAAAISACRELVEDFRDHFISPERSPEKYPEDRSKIGRGLLLVGPPGTGKTTIAAITLMALHLRWPGLFNYGEGRGLRPDRRLRFLAMADLIQLRIEAMRSDLDEAETRVIRDSLADAEEAVLLVLDDVGAEHRTASGYASGEVARLLRLRHRQARPTIMTSNIHPDQWTSVYGESLASFLYEAFEILPIFGDDARRWNL